MEAESEEDAEGAGLGVVVEFESTLLILITVAAPAGWGRLVGMSAASVGMADIGGLRDGTDAGLAGKIVLP